MSSDQQDNIGNALEIIERFGGIRPMAAKMGVAVTTVQGWKQRESIPAARRDDLIVAAKVHGVDLGSLLDVSAVSESGAVGERKEAGEASESVSVPKPSPEKEYVFSEDRRPDSYRMSQSPQVQNSKTVLVAAGVLIFAAAAIGSVFAIAPKVHKLTGQEQRIVELEQEIEAMKAAKEKPTIIPDEYKDKLQSLQAQVGDLAQQAQSYSGALDTLKNDLQNGTMQQRLAKVESHLHTIVAQAKSAGLDNMMLRVKMMQQSPEGADQLGQVMATLAGAVQMPEGAVLGGDEGLNAALLSLRESDPAVAETFKDVEPEDMKAAVMLVGMAQLRDSLARDNDSFEQDLSILKATLAEDDPELAAAIDRLAPKAKDGVLTPEGLSTEFRSLAGDLVAASLTGEDVSIEDKALARFGNLVKVEKDGEQVSGTETQIKVAAAQKLLDQGDVEGAIRLLQEIDGPAAAKTQPFIDQAQATIMARQLQQMLGQNLVLKLKNQLGNIVPHGSKGGAYMATGGGLDSMMNDFKSIVPDVGKETGGY